MSMAEAADALETAFNGTAVDRIIEGDASFDLVVRLRNSARRASSLSVRPCLRSRAER